MGTRSKHSIDSVCAWTVGKVEKGRLKGCFGHWKGGHMVCSGIMCSETVCLPEWGLTGEAMHALFLR